MSGSSTPQIATERKEATRKTKQAYYQANKEYFREKNRLAYERTKKLRALGEALEKEEEAKRASG